MQDVRPLLDPLTTSFDLLAWDYRGFGHSAPVTRIRNSTNIASRIRAAELRGYEGGHGFLFQDPAAFPAFIAFLQAPSS